MSSSISFAGTNAQTTLFTEDWETAAIGQTPPAGWGIDLVAGTNYIKFDSEDGIPSAPFSGSRLVEFQSYTLSSACSNRLKRTIPVSTIGYPYVSVDFEMAFRLQFIFLDRSKQLPICRRMVQPGIQLVQSIVLQEQIFDDWVPESIGLPAGAANQATLYIAFLFSDQGYNCHLDLVHIKG